jgi:membrane-bound lytic murein transglycosylase B
MKIRAACRRCAVLTFIPLRRILPFRRLPMPVLHAFIRTSFALLLAGLSPAARVAIAAAPLSSVDTPAIAAAQREFAADLATKNGLKQKDVLDILAKAKYQQSVIDAITRPAEAKPWKDYRPIFVTDRRVAEGVAFYRANEALLKRMEAEYGVPASIIVTIIGVETSYGRVSGKYHVLDALSTLAFHYPPRQDYFRSELRQLFLLRGPNFPYAPDELMGSYAGAMGWGQFMPSSVAQFARDGDGDGKIDLWNSLPDIFASIANYFVAHGWQKNGPVAVRAVVAENARAVTPANLEPVYPLQQLVEWGYSIPQKKSDAKLDPMSPATLVTLEGEDGPEIWITFENFYTISRYNRSPLYSLAVYQLSEAIAAGVEMPAP